MKKIPKKPETFIDSDGDGLSNWEEEHIWGSDPYDADTDGDGVDDGEQVLDGRHPVTGESLKNFFIPNEGNDYKPKSLSPKRVIFHALGAIAIKLVVVFFVIMYPLSAWMTPDNISLQSRRIIALTNDLRVELSLPVLQEDSRLNQAAYAKVQDMFIGEYFAHTSLDGSNLETFLKRVRYNFSISGENLAMGFDNPEDIVEAWKNSPTHYSNLVDKDFKDIGVSLAEDIFKDGRTVFTAQYFGRPKSIVSPPITIDSEEVDSAPVIKIESGAKAVLSAREGEVLETLATSSKPVSENTAPDDLVSDLVISDSLDILEASEAVLGVSEEDMDLASSTPLELATTKVVIDRPVGGQESVIRVEAILPENTASASAMVLSAQIPLNKSDNGIWLGQQIVYDKSSGPAVPATLSISDQAGNITLSDLASDDISPRSTSIGKQYMLLRTNPNSSMAKIFDISSIYFKIILALAIVSLGLDIFIKIKKQNASIILSGLGLIALLIVLLVV